ncbi:activating signal cointegrator 1 complex subunit 1 [Daktulosphaira vitifoliae]|uniref:activating signal cointegrator 1 complex subunit 1 n=1 Tax=Daktulosphaira vitifoliae TaxID=58002 RepID=UPI0021A9FB51|nr:activating signal cointegrator 1 complex subunit 1 [Daktulosphaira vitifoliae]
MDVLRTNILTIDGRQYRLNTADIVSSELVETQNNYHRDLSPYIEADDYDEDNDDANIYNDGDNYISKLEIPNTFYGLIIGKNRETLKSIESQTCARIKIPKQNEIIIIQGKERSHVIAAKSRIESIVKRGRSRQSITHFISFPMLNEAVVKNYLTFKEKVLENCQNCRGVSESLFNEELKLHLTITCFILCNRSEINKTVLLTKELEKSILRPKNLNTLDISIQGLDYMNDDPSDVNILYAKVHNPELQSLANEIQSFFSKSDLAQKPRNDNVKLHVTLMKTNFDENTSKNNYKNKTRSTFDATQIVQIFGDFNFGTVHLKQLHLSQRYTTDSNGYYKFSYIATL